MSFGRARCPPHPLGMSNFGSKGASLVTDIAQSEKGTIPPYNDELARAVVDESQEHQSEEPVNNNPINEKIKSVQDFMKQ